MAGFEIGDCTENAWTTTNVDTQGGGRALQGSRSQVVYRLPGNGHGPSNDALWKFFSDQGQKAGAKLASDPHGGWTAVLTAPTPQGEFWYVYRHGSGNSGSTGSFTLTTVHVLPLPQEVQARGDGPMLDAAAVNCADPPWLVRQFAYFRRDVCHRRAFDRIVVDLPGQRKVLAGHVVDVSYALTEQDKAPSALFVRNNYVNALQQTGAKLVSDPRLENFAVLTRTTPDGEFWFCYRHGSGNDEATRSYTLTTVQIAPMPQDVQVRDSTDLLDTQGTACADPPWLVRQFDYFRRDHCINRDLDTITLKLAKGARALSGRIMEVRYAQSDTSKDAVTFVLRDNYINALQGAGAKLVSDPNDIYQAVLTRPIPNGEFWYIYMHTSGNDRVTGAYKLITIQIGGPAPKSCKLEVYGVNFDFDKATLRPDSEPVLTQVQALFAGDPGYSATIGGHTDNIGQHAYNLRLSGHRADAVKAWLVAHGIAAARMRTAGYGDTRPLVPNTSDENRFRNRRVELERVGCKDGPRKG